jgi:plasmid stabilization system protein ParE
MALQWTRAAFADLRRIYEFLEPVNSPAAARAVAMIMARVERIPLQPRLGERLPGFGIRIVRRVLIDRYEIRYELANAQIFVLRIFHAREDR